MSVAPATRIDVAADDGTPIAVWSRGSGPALVLVHGSIADHTTFDRLVAELGEHVTTYALDRRGFGATPDVDPYSIEVDFADIAAVVDAAADRSGGPVGLWGHSYGASCAMGAAARSDNVSHLLLYEPTLGLSYEPGSIERIEAALGAGDDEAAIVALLGGILEMPAERIDALRAGPRWPGLLAMAPTVPRECRAERDWVYRPGQFDTVGPALVLAGSRSVAAMAKAAADAAAAIPGARVEVLEGQAHFAYRSDPAVIAAIIRDFLAS